MRIGDDPARVASTFVVDSAPASRPSGHASASSPHVMPPACVWLTGPAGAGKSTIARAVVDEVRSRDRAAVVLDDDAVDAHIHAGDPIGAVIWLASLLADAGVLTIVAVRASTRADRDRVRAALTGFAEVFVDPGFGDDGYEEPFAPELRVPTHDRSADASVAHVVSWLETEGALGNDS
jgi:adenylylsulfate kinase-like enzyme